MEIRDPFSANNLFLFGTISWEWWDINANQLKLLLEDACKTEDPINIYINSMGGDVFAALTCKDLIEKCPNPVNIIISGVAASAATIITSCKNAFVSMAKGSLLMIHNPTSIGSGESKDLRKTADLIDKTKEQIINIYQDKTSLAPDKLSKMMDECTWLDAKQALELGFINRIDDSQTVKTAINNNMVTVVNNAVSFNFLVKEPSKLENKDFNLPKIKNFLGKNTMATQVDNVSTTKSIMMSNQNPDNDKRSPELKSLDELKFFLQNKYPTLYNSLKQELVLIERERLQQLDKYASVVDKDTLNNIKYIQIGDVKDLALQQLDNEKNKIMNNATQAQKFSSDLLQAGQNAEQLLQNIGSSGFETIEDYSSNNVKNNKSSALDILDLMFEKKL